MIQFSIDTGTTWKTLAELGLIMQPGHSNPFIPEIINNAAVIGAADGVIDYGGTNSVRPFNFPLCFPFELTVSEMQQRGRALAAFLSDIDNGRPRTVWLRFEYELDKYYAARYDGTVVPERRFQTAMFNLPMVASDPYAYQIDYSSDITWDSLISMDNDELTFDDEFSFELVESGTVDVNNFGGLSLWPLIEIVGSWTTLSISANSRTLVYGEAVEDGTVTLDNQRLQAKLGPTNKNNKITGQWIKLLPGVNEVDIDGTDLDCVVSFIFQAKYL